MQNADYFKNKKVTIVGLGRSGLACANLLFDLGADVNVTDIQDNDAIRLNVSRLRSKDIKVELGRHTQEFIRNKDTVVISPGVTDNALPVIWAKQFGIALISEIEVASILCPAEIIAVTGSNGKTTVTTLIGRILQASGKKTFVCGNIGNPFCAEILLPPKRGQDDPSGGNKKRGQLAKIGPGDFVVLEVSSFQLENIKKFKPKIAVMLNISPNHLDRYKDMQEYLQAKKRIFMNQDYSDYLVINQQDPELKQLVKQAKAQLVYFSGNHRFNPNQAAVLEVGSILGIDSQTCLDVFNDFKGIEHRMEYVAEVNNIKFINDSKATTVDSCIWALKNINRPVVLIAGGKDKGIDYSLILDSAKDKVREVVLIGQAKKKIKEILKGVLSVDEAFTLEEAVTKAFYKAKAGDCVLLSPMCSSFDMFSDYEERGRVFKDIVHDLARKSLRDNL